MNYIVGVIMFILSLPSDALGGEEESFYLTDVVSAEIRTTLTDSDYDRWLDSHLRDFGTSRLRPIGELDSTQLVTRKEFYHNYIHFIKKLDCPIENLALYGYVLDLTADGVNRLVAVTNDSIWIMLPKREHFKTPIDSIGIFVDMVNDLFRFGIVESFDEQSATQLAALPFWLGAASPYHSIGLLNKWEDAYVPFDIADLPDYSIFESDPAHSAIKPPESVKTDNGFVTTLFWKTRSYDFHKASILVSANHVQIISNQVIGQSFPAHTFRGD